MKLPSLLMLFVILLVLGMGAGFWFGRHQVASTDAHDPAATAPADDDKPVATVTVAKVRQAEISDVITAYGSVIADPGDVRVLSVEFESHVVRVMVTPGQEIAEGAEVIQLEASPDAKVALTDAQNAFDAASRDLDQTKQRFEQHLATSQDLSSAQLTLKSAQLKLQSLVERGVDKPQHLKAPMAGVISKVDIQEGQIVAAGAPVIEIAAQNRILAKLGVEPEDAALLKPGQEVKLRRVEGSRGDEINGHIRVVGNRVDPTSRLVDVLVALPPDMQLILDSFVVGRMTRAPSRGLIVPRDAILADEDGFSIFTIQDGHALKHEVHIGTENKRDVQITADDVKEGDVVALVGSLELEDKMAVEVKEAATEPTSETSTESTTKSLNEVESKKEGTP